MPNLLIQLKYSLLILAALSFATPLSAQEQEKSTPDGERLASQLKVKGASVEVNGRTLLLKLDSETASSGMVTIPRLSAPIRSITWQGNAKQTLKIAPVASEWTLKWKESPGEEPTIEMVFDQDPVLPADCPRATSSGDGSVMLHAYQAATFGEKLLFEPQWYKNTVGYWTIPTDYATWQLNIDQPGTFSVAVLQGCGNGQGGSDAVITLSQGDQEKVALPFQTIDTGHFQNFRWNHLGTINVSDAGDYELKIAPKRIAKGALFDVRIIHLVRQAKSLSENP